MTNRIAVQRDFSGGEISSRMLMRADTALYQKSLLQMVNFYPTLQGSAERCPGTRYLYEIAAQNARLIPYITPDNKRGFVEITPGALNIRTGWGDVVDPDTVLKDAQVQPNAITVIRKGLIANPLFSTGPEGWVLTPPEYAGGDGARLGVWWDRYPGSRVGYIRAHPRVYKHPAREFDTTTLATTVTVATPTDNIDLSFNFLLRTATPLNSAYTATLSITSGATVVYTRNFTGDPGITWNGIIGIPLPTPAWTGDLTLTFTFVAKSGDEKYSGPVFEVTQAQIYANVEVDIDDNVVIGTVPYTAADLPDIQFVQSPFGFPNGRKELVLVHHNHPPHWLFFDGAGYTFEPIVFTNEPSAWEAGNYPAACTSYLGRLILAGADFDGEVFAVNTSNTETVWGTKSGKWDEFSDPLDPEAIAPDDSIEFAATYRSPIQWVYGQKSLLVGAQQFEYVASADGIFAPGNLGVTMQSTHGSNHVQPAGFGDMVMYPAEGGTKVRAMSASNADGGWTSPDMTLWAPELCASGIKRMYRMRNPHQMCVVLLGDGQLALFHYDKEAQVMGWSRYNLSANVVDFCVVTNSAGNDVLYLVVPRWVEGVRRLYVEAIPNWTDTNVLNYLTSASLYSSDVGATNVIPALGHLEGMAVQIVADGNYIGTRIVTGGQIELFYDNGLPYYFFTAEVGLAFTAYIQTLPLGSPDPGDVKRRVTCAVRVRGSSRPLINDQRPPDRDPATLMDRSQQVELFGDFKVAQLGSDLYQLVVIKENLPLRCEVLGIYSLTANNSV